MDKGFSQVRQDGANLPKSYPTLLGFARREVTNRGTLRLRFNLGRIAVAVVVLGLAMWGGKSVGLFYFFRDVRNFKEVSLLDTFLFPLNRTSIRIAQGDYQVEQAKAALEREEYRRAFMLLREGITRSPANMEGRELLAQIYLGWRADLAVDLMVEGLDYGEFSDSYIRLLFTLLLQERQDKETLELSGMLLEGEDLEDSAEGIVRAFRMQSALLVGRYDLLENLLGQREGQRNIDDVLIGAQYYRKIGQWQRAVALLSAVLNAQRENPSPQIYIQLIDTLKEAGELSRARELALEFSIRNPLDWTPRAKLIDLLSASGFDERRDREIRSMLQEHRNDERAMTTLAQLSATYGNVWAASRLYELALENGFNLGVFSLSLAESMIEAGDYAQAIELCNELAQEDPSWLVNAESSFNAIRALAYLGSGNQDLGQLYLNNFISSRGSKVNQLHEAARTFRNNGFPEYALEILEEAHNRDSRNEQILSRLIEVEMEVGAFFSVASHLRALFDLRRPSYDMVESVHEQLQGDRFLFTEGRMDLLEQLESLLKEREPVDLGFWDSPS